MDNMVDGNSNTFRAFLAIDLPTKIKQKVARTISIAQKYFRYRNINWVNSENLHITLRFLGNINPTQCEDLIDKISPIIFNLPQSKVILTRLMVLPSRKSPKIIAVVPTPTAPIAEIVLSIEDAVVNCGIQPETRLYKPHLTLARIKMEQLQHIKKLKIEPIPFEIRQITLFKSQLTKQGPIYTILKTFKLQQNFNGNQQEEFSPMWAPELDSW